MDATTNETDRVSIQGFPTIKFWPAGNKGAPMDFEGDRTVDGFIDFINSQRDINLPNSSSGSTLNAVLDLDGLYDLIIEDEDVEQYEDLYDDMRAYQQFLLRRNDVM